MYACPMCMQHLKQPEDGVRIPETASSRQWVMRFLEQNPSPLEEQQVCLTAEPSFQAYIGIF